ncbi:MULTISPECIES: nuclear transport factor 2 family protein [Dyella]|nr:MULTISPECIES: nuclear transport factor 2 family protein [Dyella]
MTHRLARMMFAALACCASLGAAASDDDTDPELTRTIAGLDQKVFDAYNRCDLDTFTTFFAPDVEFYHDKGGATFDRQSVVDNTRKYICHKVKRELLTATLKVYPIKDYGAIEEGEHRFCELATGKCEGSAKFLMIWRLKDGQWQMTRVVSFGHRALTPAEIAAMDKATH